MKSLKCIDIDPSSNCGFEAKGNSDEEVLAGMMAHAKVDHADGLAGASDDQIAEKFRPHIKEQAEVAI